jgi:hypothetical protein
MEPNSPRDILTLEQRALLPSAPGTQPDDTFVDHDPSTTRDPHPGLALVREAINAIAPDAFAGIYQTSDQVIHVGLTPPVGRVLGSTSLAAAFPNLCIQTFSAPYSWHQLLLIADKLGDQLADNPSGPMVSVTPDPTTNSVRVGFTDVNSAAAVEVKFAYASAVTIMPDQPVECLAIRI